MNAPLPTIRWGILIKNRSLFPISLDGEIKNNLYFEGVELTQERLVKKQEIQNLPHDQEGSIVFEQRLSPLEANFIKQTPEGKFSFQSLEIHIKGADGFDYVKSQQIIIPNDFRPKLHATVDKASIAIEPVETERDNLKAQVSELAALDDELEILEAWYGIQGVKENDVKAALGKLIVNNKLKLDRRYNDIFAGYPDPVRESVKQLRIQYRHGDQAFSISLPENTTITLPVPYRKWS